MQNFIKEKEYMSLEVGLKAPKFAGATDGGGKVALADLKGKYVVLYFYPKDDTPGCTTEACGFNDSIDEITSLGAEVIGVSPDSPSKHDKFKAKFNLNFRLLADEDHSIAEAYKAWGEKSMYGKKYMGVFRISYIISPDGKIAKAYPKVTPKDHAAEVIADLKALQGKS